MEIVLIVHPAGLAAIPEIRAIRITAPVRSTYITRDSTRSTDAETAIIFSKKLCGGIFPPQIFFRSAYTYYVKKIKRMYLFFQEKYRLFSQKKYTTIAGTLVYFFIMSAVPFSFWLTLLAGKWLPWDSETLFEMDFLERVEDLIIFLRDNAKSATGGASVVLALTTLYSSTNLFYHMRRSGELLYDYDRQKGGFKVRFSALVLMFLMILFFVVFLIVLVSGYWFFSVFFSGITGKAFSYIFIICMSFLLAFIMNFYICPYRLKIRDVLPGSFLTTVLWTFAAVAFSVYLRFSDLKKLYGAVSVLIVFLLWLYIMMNCFVIGVIVNSELSKKKKKEHKIF